MTAYGPMSLHLLMRHGAILARQIRRQHASAWERRTPDSALPFPTVVRPPQHRVVGRINGHLVGLTQYPSNGPPPPADVPAQQLDCPHRGRCKGCWITVWPADQLLVGTAHPDIAICVGSHKPD